MNTALNMIIEIVSTDPRAPSVADQQALNRQDGTEPERTFEFPEWRDQFHMLVYERDADVVVVASPKVFGTMADARPLLERMDRAGASFKLPGQKPMPVQTAAQKQAILDALAKERWRKPSAKQRKNPGRPPKRSQPSDDVRRIGEKMWLRPKSKDDPDGYTRNQVVDFHEEEMGRKVQVWELKYWYGDKRAPDLKEQSDGN